MKHIFRMLSGFWAALIILAALSVGLTACGNPETETTTGTDQSTTSTKPNNNDDTDTPIPTGEVFGIWFSSRSNVVMDIKENSNNVKYYSISPGYYEYYAAEDSTYIYDEDEQKLTLTLNEKSYDFIFDPDEDTLTISKTVYKRQSKLPTEHPRYSFPKYTEMELSKIITLPDYQAINIREEAIAAAKIQIYIDHRDAEVITPVPVTDRPVEYGDLVSIDYVGKKDGVPFENGTSEKPAELKILYHNSGFIPGFAEGIVGHYAGEEFEIPITFPEDYHAPELAGKAVVFEITLHNVYDVELTEDQFASDSITYEECVLDTAMKLSGNFMLNRIYDEADLIGELPEEVYIYFYQAYLDQAHYTANLYGMTYEDFCKFYGDQTATFLAQAKSMGMNYVICHLIAQNESLSWTEEEFNALFKEYTDDLVKNYQFSEEDAKLYVTNNQLDSLKAELTCTIVSDYLTPIGMKTAE